MLENARPVTIGELKKEVWSMKNRGFRFVTMTCLETAGQTEILYHFDKEYRFEHLRLSVPIEVFVPSVSDIYFAAVLAENEIKDGFGVAFDGLAIDYDGKFLVAEGAGASPMRKSSPAVIKKGAMK